MRERRETKQRAAILEVLRKLRSHPTAAELHLLVRKRLPRISLGTVYRNLDVLARDGAIRKLVIGQSEARFDGDLSRHEHVRCVNCGGVADVPPTVLPGVDLAEVSRRSGFEIIGYRMEFVGVCPECRRRRGLSLAETSRPETGETDPAVAKA